MSSERNDSGNGSDNFWDDADIVYSYSRRQAMRDGVLVDLTNSDFGDRCRELGFRINVAITSGAWSETVGGIDEDLPAGQTIEGRIWDVLYAFRYAIQVGGMQSDRVHFKVSVLGLDNRRKTVNLWALIGPGDAGEPVMTIMLEGED